MFNPLQGRGGYCHVSLWILHLSLFGPFCCPPVTCHWSLFQMLSTKSLPLPVIHKFFITWYCLACSRMNHQACKMLGSDRCFWIKVLYHFSGVKMSWQLSSLLAVSALISSCVTICDQAPNGIRWYPCTAARIRTGGTTAWWDKIPRVLFRVTVLHTGEGLSLFAEYALRSSCMIGWCQVLQLCKEWSWLG